jgi:hypothetical protein
MVDRELTQAEADALIALEKVKADAVQYLYPPAGGFIVVPLISVDRTEEFQLDIRRGRLDLAKVTQQNRARRVIILVRLDLGGPPHRNPDGVELPCPHLHVFREGYGDKWAVPLPSEKFPEPGNLWQSLQDFLRFCNVSDPNVVDRDLFV